MKNYILLASILMLSVLMSCHKDLDTEPLDKKITTSKNVFDDPASYKEFLAKLYGSLTLTGQRGEYGDPEIPNGDEGQTSFLRTYWTLQEIPTDEAITAWGDAGLSEFEFHNISAQNLHVSILYRRVFINIAYCNEFIREVGDRVGNLSTDLQTEVNQYLAEARFLRAYFYSVALDLWGNVPFVTEENEVGAYLPEQINRPELFNYVENELLDIIPLLIDAGQNEYARADKAAAWMLLAKLYLNAEVYVGQDRYTDCLTYCNNIINSGQYTLASNYDELFLADNHRLTEIILPIAEDGDNTRNYGGVTFIIHAMVGGSMDADNDYGIGAGGWYGNRPTTAFVNKFDDVTGNTDVRAMFHTDGQEKLEIDDPLLFNQGYLCTKFKNVTSDGIKGKNNMFVDTDFPLFRLADVYLMYAEAVLRGGAGGDAGTALGYINNLRNRAYGDASGNVSQSELTLAFIIDERGRELYWEGQRRSDLIRFGLFTGDNYLWDWKGGVKEGKGTSDYVKLFPLPSIDVSTNTKLEQNTGY